MAIAMPDSLYQKQLHELDSVQQQTKKEYTRLKNEYDSVDQHIGSSIAKIQRTTDSLGNLNLPTGTYTKKLDSLKLVKESKLDSIKSKTQALKEQSAKKIQNLKLRPNVNQEVQHFTQALNKLDVSLPNTDLNFPTIPSLGNMPTVSMPGVNVPSISNLSTPGINTSLPQGVGEVKVPEVGGELKQVGNQVKEVTDKIKDPPAKEEVIAKAEEKITESGPVKDVTEKMGVPKDVPLSGQPTKEELQEQVKKQAIDHFAGKEKQVQAAMGQLSKLKQKHSNVQSIKDLPKKAPNPMKEKYFVERLVPGIAFQFLLRNEWLADFNPYVGYRLNGRITAGMGWNQRWGFTKENGFNHNAKIYGPRVYGECMVLKGVSVRLELETMYTRTPPILKQLPNYDESHREWVPGIFAGMKKDYKIAKRLKGTIIVLYNLYNPDYKSPYGDRLMSRFGLEYSFKKKRKESVSSAD